MFLFHWSPSSPSPKEPGNYYLTEKYLGVCVWKRWCVLQCWQGHPACLSLLSECCLWRRKTGLKCEGCEWLWFYLTPYKVAHCELREVLLPGGGSSSSLCGWSDMNAVCWLLMNIHQLCVCVEGFIACHCSLILGIRERRQLLCLVSDVGQGKTPHPGSLEGPRLVGPEREPCTAQRIPNRECPRTSKRRKIKRNPEQAVNIVLWRLLFSSPKFMASVPALPISHHCSGPA